jgi:3-oxoacyl-[acyl-carrier protein] reductase
MTHAASRSVAGSTVLITGAASGMGRAAAEVFAAEGTHVALTDIAAESVREVADDLVHRGLSAEAWTLDVADADAIEAVVAQAAARFGGLDIVINNAGVGGFAAIDAANYEAIWTRALGVMLTAHQRIVRAALPYLRKSAAPRIVNIASTEAWAPPPATAPTPRRRPGSPASPAPWPSSSGRKGSPSTASARARS